MATTVTARLRRPRTRALPLAPDALEGRAATEPEIVRWVARHIDHPDPDPHDCPDPFAWTLLRQCRGDSSLTKDFVEKLWVKLIPTRAQADESSSKDLDGKPTLELLERIQAHHDEAVKASGSAPLASPKAEDAAHLHEAEV